MVKKWRKVRIFYVGLFLFVWSSAAPASAASYGPYQFTTGNDKWDAGSFTVNSGKDVTVFINDWSYTDTSKSSTDTLKVRICSLSACTSPKAITYDKNYTTFTDMSGGTYYGWVEKVHNPSKDVTGYITYRVE